MELKIGLKYTCPTNGLDWHGEIINIGSEIVQVNLFYNNEKTGTGSDPIKKILNYFETGYFKIKEDFILPEKWCIKGNDIYEYDKINQYARNLNASYWTDRNNHAKTHYLHVDNHEYKYGMIDKNINYTEITFEQFEEYILKLQSNKYTKLINILKYIDERTRTLT